MNRKQFVLMENMTPNSRDTFNVTAVLLSMPVLFYIFSIYDFLILKTQIRHVVVALSCAMTLVPIVAAWTSSCGKLIVLLPALRNMQTSTGGKKTENQYLASIFRC